jgi:hypothetical protein
MDIPNIFSLLAGLEESIPKVKANLQELDGRINQSMQILMNASVSLEQIQTELPILERTVRLQRKYLGVVHASFKRVHQNLTLASELQKQDQKFREHNREFVTLCDAYMSQSLTMCGHVEQFFERADETLILGITHLQSALGTIFDRDKQAVFIREFPQFIQQMHAEVRLHSDIAVLQSQLEQLNMQEEAIRAEIKRIGEGFQKSLAGKVTDNLMIAQNKPGIPIIFVALIGQVVGYLTNSMDNRTVDEVTKIAFSGALTAVLSFLTILTVTYNFSALSRVDRYTGANQVLYEGRRYN